jgi:hypothetical protein
MPLKVLKKNVIKVYHCSRFSLVAAFEHICLLLLRYKVAFVLPQLPLPHFDLCDISWRLFESSPTNKNWGLLQWCLTSLSRFIDLSTDPGLNCIGLLFHVQNELLHLLEPFIQLEYSSYTDDITDNKMRLIPKSLTMTNDE